MLIFPLFLVALSVACAIVPRLSMIVHLGVGGLACALVVAWLLGNVAQAVAGVF